MAQETTIKLDENQSAAVPASVVIGPAPSLRLDLGCGTNKKQGFMGVDVIAFEGVDVVCDLGKETWPWADGSVEEAHCSHFVEHLAFNPERPERIHFVNELYRVLKKGGKATIITPHWCSPRQWGDYTHREPVSEWWYFYLNADWRKKNAPHDTAYTCDFDATPPGYAPNPALQVYNQERVMYALTWYKSAADDMIATLIKNR